MDDFQFVFFAAVVLAKAPESFALLVFFCRISINETMK